MKPFLCTAMTATMMTAFALSLYADDSVSVSCTPGPSSMIPSSNDLQLAAFDQYVMEHLKIRMIDNVEYEQGFTVNQNGTTLGHLYEPWYLGIPAQPPYIYLHYVAEKGDPCCPNYRFTDFADRRAPEAAPNKGCYDCYTTIYYVRCNGRLGEAPYLVFDAGNNQPLANVTVPVTAWIAGDRSGFATVGYIPEQDPGHAVTIRNEQGDLIAWAIEGAPSSSSFDHRWDISINSTAIASPAQADLANPKAILYALAYRFYNALPATEQCRQTCITERNKLIGGLVGGIGGTVAIIAGIYIAYLKSTRHYQSIQ